MFLLGLIGGALSSREWKRDGEREAVGFSRFASNGRALPQQMVVVVIAAASEGHLPFLSDGYRNTDALFAGARCRSLS